MKEQVDQGGAIPTPRTDATELEIGRIKALANSRFVQADFARQLERETIAQAKRIEELERALRDIESLPPDDSSQLVEAKTIASVVLHPLRTTP